MYTTIVNDLDGLPEGMQKRAAELTTILQELIENFGRIIGAQAMSVSVVLDDLGTSAIAVSDAVSAERLALVVQECQTQLDRRAASPDPVPGYEN